MNKAEMLKQKAQANTEDLYITNENITNSDPLPQSIEKNKESINKEKINIDKPKMLSFRIPQSIIDNIDKYAYVQRMKKQDLICMIFESFFEGKKAQIILEQYDNIIKVQNEQ